MQTKLRSLRLSKGYSMQNLAERIGTSKAQIDKLEKGQRRLTIDWMRRLAGGLDCDLRDILNEEPSQAESGKGAMSLSIPASYIAPMPRDLPVLGAAKGGADGFFFDNGKVNEMTGRPVNLLGVQNAFALYTAGDSMEPRFFAGELLYINPNRPLSKGCFVAVELLDGQGLVKQYIKSNDQTIVLHQFNPDIDIVLKRSEIKNIWRIIGSAEGG